MKMQFIKICKAFFFSFLLVFYTAQAAYSQHSEIIEINWSSPTELREGEKVVLVPTIIGQALDGNRPNFFLRKDVNFKPGTKVLVSVLTSEPALSEEIKFLKDQYIEVRDLQYNASISGSDGSNLLYLNFFPFINVGSSIHRILSVELKFLKNNVNTANNKSFKANSVLQEGSGYWYKISVAQSGIYKIDKSFLLACGIDVATLNPQHINIFGNGEGRLSEKNGSPRVDDLAKNAIVVVGEGDGVFDDEDYIMFYGWGPHRWSQSTDSTFDQDRHIYSDISCYFININPSESPERITNATLSLLPVTHSVQDYNYYDIHELDMISLVQGGQRWYGELFDTDLQKTFSFSVPSIVSSVAANFQVSMASNAKFPSGNSQSYAIGATQLFTASLPTASEWGRSVHTMKLNSPSASLPLKITVARSSPDILSYLDRIVLNCRRSLDLHTSQFNFRDLASVGVGNIGEFNLTNIPVNGFVWEITDRHSPAIVNGVLTVNNFVFKVATDSLREFVVSNGVNFLTPVRVGVVSHQNLHALSQADFLIVTHKSFIAQAQRLSTLHQQDGLSVHVVTTEQIYNEFSSGMLDAMAIRTFAKMFYDRAAVPADRPKHLLLFGDGTYDPKNRVANNNNFVLTYQMLNSESHIWSTPTDDFFGILEDEDGISSSDPMSIGIGRLLISDNDMARQQVDKIEHYMKNGSTLFATQSSCTNDPSMKTFGDWRMKYVQIADDEENGYFIVNNTEPSVQYVSDSFPSMNVDKIYLDAFQQITSAGGQRYPDVVNAINDRISRGVLVMNYVGHGGEVGVAEERIITVPQIQSWSNIDALTLLVSATCEFTKFDDPDRVSAGEWASINPTGSAIALMTTTRAIFFGTNGDIVSAFFKNVFERDANYKPLTFGEIFRRTKNEVGGDNKRSFVLIGDPALRIAMPEMRVVTDSINGLSPAIEMDTVNALSKVTIKGHLEDFNSNKLTSFNGVLYPTIFDKPKEQMTLGNDPSSPIIPFDIQNNRVYRGKASVKNGDFEFTFIVPKDINYAIDFGKISYYAENGVYDAMGSDSRFYIGGIDPNGLLDSQGPEIELFLNDENFVNGGLTDESPTLIAKVFDENGINTVGNGVGHDIVAIIDGNTGEPIVMNEFYTADLDSYQSGEIRFEFSNLAAGNHTLSLKVWDVNNNSSESQIDFVVQEQVNFTLNHVLNYPNPFTTHTEFFFEHNQICNSLEAQIQIFTVSGKLIRTINQSVHTEGYRSEGVVWNGKDDFGDQLAKGVYIYRLKVKNNDGEIAEKLEKLMILK